MPTKAKAKRTVARKSAAKKTLKPTPRLKAKAEPAAKKIEKKIEPRITEERITMETIELTIPAMYADHHVTTVKRLLSPLAGVENVFASSAFKAVAIEFNPAKTSPAALVKALSDAGYVPGAEELVGEAPFMKPDPAWEKLGVRATTTSQIDLQLSGEFRKY